MTELQANVAGFIGMACVVFAYAYQTSKDRPNPYVQHGVNLAGAVLLGISLLTNMNPASFALEFVWGGVAIWGLVKAALGRRRNPR
jgi:hypothetical protein